MEIPTYLHSNKSFASLIYELKEVMGTGNDSSEDQFYTINFLNALFNSNDIKLPSEQHPTDINTIKKPYISSWIKQDFAEEKNNFLDKRQKCPSPAKTKTIIGYIYNYKHNKKISALDPEGLIHFFTSTTDRINKFTLFLISRDILEKNVKAEDAIKYIEEYLTALVDSIDCRIENKEEKASEVAQIMTILPQTETAPPVNNAIIDCFRYDSNRVNFYGRIKEMNVLERMCGLNSPFFWICVSGRGGIGKTRLIYETCNHFENYSNWEVIRPSHSKLIVESVIEKIQSSDNNFIICFDYVKFNTDNILELIIWLIENPFEKRKIRVILIERYSSDFNAFDNYFTEEYRFKDIPEDIVSADGLSIELKPFSENGKSNCYKNIISDYISNGNKRYETDSDEVTAIYEQFKELDPILMRPLLALFTAEAWVSGHDMKQWDKKSALNYFMRKENKYLMDIICVYITGDKLKAEKYYNAIKLIIGLATYSGGISLSEHSRFINEETGIDTDDEYLLKFLSDSGYLAEKDKVIAVEPDLIGEFSVIDLFDSISIEKTVRFIDYLINYDIKIYIDYTKKIYDDYDAIFFQKEWSSVLSNISFPENLHFVRHDLFRDCKFLKEIKLHSQVYEIEDKAFQNAVNLETILVTSSVEGIGKMAFMGCKSLKNIIYENVESKSYSLIRIDEMAFRDCESLEYIDLPYSIQKIEAEAFKGCVNLKEIILPQRLKTIPAKCFAGCVSLKKCVFSDSIEIIQPSAFNASGLEEACLPANLKTLDTACFIDCLSLKKVIINSISDVSINVDCFKNCRSLETVTLSNVISIDKFSFFNCQSLKEIVISTPDIKIKEGAFMNCSSLETADLSETRIKIIPSNIFNNCTSLKKLSLPSSLKNISPKAFYNCTALQELDLPDKLEMIDEQAFYNCSELQNMKLPGSLLYIKAKAFCGCSHLKADNFSNIDPEITKEICGFSLTAIDKKIIKLITSDESAEKIILPNTVRGILNNTFSRYQSLISIVLSKQCTTIGEAAFAGCVNLKSVYLNGSRINNINKNAFSDCSSLRKIYGVLYINKLNENVFRNCSELTTLNTKYKISNIKENALLRCDKISINIDPELSSMRINKKLIYKCLRRGMAFTFNNSSTILQSSIYPSIDGFVFKKITKNELLFLDTYKTSEEVIIPPNCIRITGQPFFQNHYIKKITIPDRIKDLPDKIFAYCESLKEVRLTKNIKTIPVQAFMKCSSLVSVIFDGEEPNHIPNGTKVKPFAFNGCKSLEYIKLPDDLKIIHAYLFNGCFALKEVVLPSALEVIKPYAFNYCRKLKRIKFPDTLKITGTRCFGNCTELKRVDLENTALTRIGNEAFRNCISVSEVKLPRNIESIGSFAFSDCHNLKEIDMSCTIINNIGVAAFFNCKHLKNVILPPYLDIINKHCFKYCFSLEKIALPDSIVSIENNAFYKCISLKEIKLPTELKSVGISAFSYSGLQSIVLPDSLETLNNGLFEHCSDLTEVRLPQYLKNIPNDCFKDCGLSSIDLPQGLKKIGVGAFKFCYDLKKISIPETVKTINTSAFNSCVKLEEIELPEQIKIIMYSAFAHCISLKRINLGNTRLLGKYAFYDCISLEEINLSGIEKEIDDSTFRNCISLKTVTFSDTTNTINTSAFMMCVSLMELKLPASLEIIGESAFSDCSSLEKVNICSPNIMIKPFAFKNCSNLNYISIPDNSSIYDNSFENCRAGQLYNKSDKITIIPSQDHQ